MYIPPSRQYGSLTMIPQAENAHYFPRNIVENQSAYQYLQRESPQRNGRNITVNQERQEVSPFGRDQYSSRENVKRESIGYQETQISTLSTARSRGGEYNERNKSLTRDSETSASNVSNEIYARIKGSLSERKVLGSEDDRALSSISSSVLKSEKSKNDKFNAMLQAAENKLTLLLDNVERKKDEPKRGRVPDRSMAYDNQLKSPGQLNEMINAVRRGENSHSKRAMNEMSSSMLNICRKDENSGFASSSKNHSSYINQNNNTPRKKIEERGDENENILYHSLPLERSASAEPRKSFKVSLDCDEDRLSIEKKYDSLKEEFSSLHEKYSKLKLNLLAAESEQIEAMKRKIDELNMNLADLNKTVKDKDASIREMEDSEKILKLKFESKEEELRRVERNLKAMLEENKHRGEESENMIMKTLEETRRELERWKDKYSKNSTALKEELKEKEKMYEKSLKEAVSELEQWRSNFNKADVELNDLKYREGKFRQRVSELEQEVEDLKRGKLETEKRAAEIRDQTEKYWKHRYNEKEQEDENNKSAAERKIKELEFQLNLRAVDDYNVLRSESSANKEALDRVAREKVNAELMASEKAREVETLTIKIQDLQRREGFFQKDIKLLRNQISDLNEKINSQEKALEDERARSFQMEKKMKEAEHQANLNRNSFEKYTSSWNNESSQRITEIQKSLGETQRELSECQNKLAVRETEIFNLKRSLEEQRFQLKEEIEKQRTENKILLVEAKEKEKLQELYLRNAETLRTEKEELLLNINHLQGALNEIQNRNAMPSPRDPRSERETALNLALKTLENEFDNYRNQVKEREELNRERENELEAKLEELREHVENLRQRNENLILKKDALIVERDETRDKLDAVRDRAEALKREKDQLASEIKILGDEKRKSDKEAHAYTVENKELAKELNVLADEKKDLAKELHLISEEKKTLNHDVEALKEQIKLLSQEKFNDKAKSDEALRVLQSDYNQIKQALAYNTQGSASIEAELVTLRERVAKLNSESNALSQQMKSLQKENGSLSSVKAQLNDENTRLQGEATRLREELLKLATEKSQLQEVSNRKIEETRADSEERQAALEAQLEKLIGVIKTKNKEIEDLKKKKTLLEDTIKESESLFEDNMNLKKLLDLKEDKIREIKAKQFETTKEVQDFEYKKFEFEGKIRRLEHEIEDLNTLVSSKEGQIQRLLLKYNVDSEVSEGKFKDERKIEEHMRELAREIDAKNQRVEKALEDLDFWKKKCLRNSEQVEELYKQTVLMSALVESKNKIIEKLTFEEESRRKSAMEIVKSQIAMSKTTFRDSM